MPVIAGTPKNVRPFLFHGLDLAWEGREQALGDCPFCGKEGKFAVSVESGQWRCFVCAEGTDRGGGNVWTFLRLLWKRSDEATDGQTEILAKERRLLYGDTLTQWGVCQSIITEEWLVPGYGIDGKLNQLYRYCEGTDGKRRLLATPELHHQIHGIGLPKLHREVYVCEGPWDAIALWEAMRLAKATDKGLVLTGNPLVSLLSSRSVVAVPGCKTFPEQWVDLFDGKVVNLMYDSDHPRVHQGKTFRDGYEGMKRVAGMLTNAAGVHYLQWGKDGYDASLPSGYDIRDFLSAGATAAERVRLLGLLLSKVAPIPKDWTVGGTARSTNRGSTEIECIPCSDWRILVNSWREAMHWTDGLDRALAVMLACVTSTKAVGDQLWCKVIGPAACGKSTLCEALSVNRKYVLAKSTIRGFHSGYRESNSKDEDNSLVSELYDKTLVTKDGDTLLQSPNLQQILSEARDLYDSTSRTHYRNRASKDYHGVRMTWILCGTSSLRSIDSSELGERFIDCVIMEGIDDDLEDEILWRVVNRADRAMSYESNGDLVSQHDPDLVRAMQLTGGYVGYLRSNAKRLLEKVQSTEESMRRCIQLGKFVAYMRARPSLKQDETAEREFATRLVSQMTRLSKCLAVVMNRDSIDAGVMDYVTKVALDTARGVTLNIVKHLHEAGDKGLEVPGVSMLVSQSKDKTTTLLRFLRRIGAVDVYQKTVSNVRGAPRWRLTPKLKRLYEEAVR